METSIKDYATNSIRKSLQYRNIAKAALNKD